MVAGNHKKPVQYMCTGFCHNHEEGKTYYLQIRPVAEYHAGVA